MVVPGLEVVAIKEVGLLGEPVRDIGAGLRNEINLEAGSGEDVEWMQSFADEEAGGLLAVEESGLGRSDTNNSLARENHFDLFDW